MLQTLHTRACLLSGGLSRRMGCDKALLPHPSGGIWIDHMLKELQAAGLAITIYSRHRTHLDRAGGSPNVTPLAEPSPWQGPLRALLRLMDHYPDHWLLTVPVDMPALGHRQFTSLLQHRDVAGGQASRVPPWAWVAGDGDRLQPMLGLYASHESARISLRRYLDALHQRRWLGWLATIPHQPVRLPSNALINVNRPGEWLPRSGEKDPSRPAVRPRPEHPLDHFQRPLGVLRLSLTARCNLACPTCCPDSTEPQGGLTQSQRLKVIRVAVSLGARTLRLTGGEPLLAEGLQPLLRAIQAERGPEGALADLQSVALTTNGVLLTPERAQALREDGLDRLTVSLDGWDPGAVAAMAGLKGGQAAGERLLQQVLAGINAARDAGFDPHRGELKLNSVIRRGVNDDQLLPLARLARELKIELRLIEFMDVGNRNSWNDQAVLPASSMVEQIHRYWPLDALDRVPGSTASSWSYRDGRGGVGVIASITEPFCGDCNRLRVTADGQAYTCLFSGHGQSLKPHLNDDQPDSVLQERLRSIWEQRQDRYSEERLEAPEATRPRRRPAEMAYLGG